MRQEQVLSSDEEAPITSVARPRQRSLRRLPNQYPHLRTAGECSVIKMPVYIHIHNYLKCKYMYLCSLKCL